MNSSAYSSLTFPVSSLSYVVSVLQDEGWSVRFAERDCDGTVWKLLLRR